MFLRVETDPETGSTKYSLRSATRAFLSKSSKDQDRFLEIQARVENFNRQALSTPPALLMLLDRARRNRDGGDPRVAWKLLTNPDLPRITTEHPKFKAELGITASVLNPPNVTDARKYFEDAYIFGHRNHEMYQYWLKMEKQAESGTTKGIDICEKVISTPGFDLRTKANFLRNLAYLQVMKSINLQLSSPEESASLRREATLNNLKAFRDAHASSAIDLNSFRARAADSVIKFSEACGKWFPNSAFGTFIESLATENVPLTPLLGEIVSSFTSLLRRASDDERKGIESSIRRIVGKLTSKKVGKFGDESERLNFIQSLERVIESV